MKTFTRTDLITVVVITVLVMGSSFFLSCRSNDEPDSSATYSVKQTDLIMPQEFKNGVFYFDCSHTGRDFVKIFAMSLAQFKENHPELVVMTATSSNRTPDGRWYDRIVGYFVSCEPRQE